LKIPWNKSRANSQGYGIALLMVFLMASVLLASSMTLMLSPIASGYQPVLRDTTTAKALTDQVLNLARTDVLNQMKLGTTITTSYRYPASGTNTIIIPSYPGSGASNTVGSYYVTVTNARGFTFTLNAVVTVNGTTISKKQLVQLHAPSHVLDMVPTAVAAYSTRKLRLNYSGYVLKLRNSSGTSQDIGFDTSENLNATAVATLLGTSSNSPPLDSVSGAVAAYSLRKLRAAYAGKAIRVRRSSDNLELDIGFNASGDLDTTALLAHVLTGNGYVVTWYDQSGNGLNATQPTATNAANQPLIVISGAINTLGTHPSILFNGNNTYLQSPASALFPSGAGARTMNAVEQLSNSSGWFCTLAWGSQTTWGASGMIVGTSMGMHGYGVDTTVSGLTADTLPHVATVTYDGTGVSAYLDTATVLSNSAVSYTTTASTSLLIGQTVDGHNMPGNESEIIIYGSVLSAGLRGTLVTNQSNYYINGCGTVITWYDQSGNGLDATQATLNNQPILCTGSLNQLSGRLTLQFAGGNYLTTATSAALPSGAGARTMNVVTQVTNPSTWYGGYSWGSSSNSAGSGIEVGTQVGYHGYGNDAATSVTADTNPHVETVTYDGSTITAYLDGVSKLSTGRGYNTTASTSLSLGKTVDGHYLIGKESEAIIYGRVLDSISRGAIENSQLQYY